MCSTAVFACLQDSTKAIPLLVESCIRCINLHGEFGRSEKHGAKVFPCLIPNNRDWLSSGLQHQGIFRVSGSQVEVNDIKNSFERGEPAA